MELERLEDTLRQANEKLMAYLREVFGAEDDPRAVELLRLTGKKEVAEDALVTYLLDTMPMDELGDLTPTKNGSEPPRGGFLH